MRRGKAGEVDDLPESAARKITEEEWAEILAARFPESNKATESDNNGTIGDVEGV
jgi:hypothetical protein